MTKPAKPTIGHNSTNPQLKSYVERIERLEGEISELNADKREVYSEAKGSGFDPKIIRQIVRLRNMKPADRAEQEALLDTYKAALGMLADTPLGKAAITKAGE